MNYAVAGARDPEVADVEVYRVNREQLLARGQLTGCEGFWLHEPGITAELRPGADDDLDAEWTDVYGDPGPSERQIEARRKWLAEHPLAA